ncbi:hypothetical protein KR084_000546 [Drosophila pseudotakahashii]|nr:hypothetical protein KR084_000546 [Drosophila pseudotakahashii]
MSGETDSLGVSLSYSELQAIDQEDIILLVDVDSAVNICNECVTNESANPVDVLTLWFSKLLRAYIDESVCCIRAVKEMCKWFQQESDSGAEIHSAHIKLFQEALAFITVSRDHVLKAGERLVHICTYLLFSMINFFLVGSDRSEHQLVVDLQFAVLSLLKENTTGSNRVHSRVTPLMQKIMDIADFECKQMKDLELPVRTSETITYMCLHYMSYVNLKDEQIPEWLKETVSHLCDMILSYLEGLYKNVSITVPAEKLEQFMEVMRTYFLMLVQIFENGVTQIDDEVAGCLMDLIICEQARPSYYSDKDIQQLISTYVRPHLLDLYEMVYSFQKCQEYLLYGILCTPEWGNFDACMDFIAAVSTDNAGVLPKTCQTLSKIFECLFKDATNFVNADRYERIVDAFGSLLFLVSNRELHSYFCAGLFEKDIITSQVCADILILCFRLKEVDKCWEDNDIEQAVAFWNKCNNSFALFSQNPSQLHVQRFLKYFHNIGKQGLPVISVRNFRHLSAVATSDAQVGMTLLKRLEQISSSAPTKVEVYYETVTLLELLSEHNQIDCSQWFHRTSEIAKEVMCNANSTTFTSAYFKLLARGTKSTQLLILRGLNTNNGCNNWHRQKFFDTCKASDDAQLRVFSARHVIGVDVQPLLEALRKKPETLDLSLDSSFDVSKSSYTRRSEHNCPGPSFKRKRSEIPAREILHEIYEGSLQLGQCSETFDSADWDLYKKILVNLNRIVPRP